MRIIRPELFIGRPRVGVRWEGQVSRFHAVPSIGSNSMAQPPRGFKDQLRLACEFLGNHRPSTIETMPRWAAGFLVLLLVRLFVKVCLWSPRSPIVGPAPLPA